MARYFSSLEADRLRMDDLLVQHFREAGCDGPVWLAFLDKLLAYGLEIVTNLVKSGAMFARCDRRERSVARQEVPLHEAEDLASEAVLEGFGLFRDKGILGGRWSIERGPLKEYFVNACVLAFPNVYRRWRTSNNAWHERHLLDAWTRLEHVAATGGLEDAVMAREAVDALFAELSEDRRTLLFLKDQNYSHAEIGEFMRISPRAVEGKLRRAKEAAREASKGGR
ncbi:RNA polymerase sigma factor [Nocardia sp. NRRL S-836]|uniref:RNA polymerase sigma factor n=1 Tax=Nocardia sp. NRRL S-836 TaxID=1519492 RepID=UPI0018D19FDA|nr:sigma-70 family RNA polymerase sigma factor [Nocardia sp. NRRL S-836]